MAAYRRGDHGAAVAEIRGKLTALGLLPERAGFDVFDDACDRAVRGFQQTRGLRADGVVGPETYRALDEARWSLGDRLLGYTPGRPQTGDDVVALQRRLSQLGFHPGRSDGIFGPRTEAALREFQRNVGLASDGSCGPRTLDALARLSRAVVGGSAERLRDELRLSAAGPTLAGKVVVLDPGHGDGDPGAAGAGQTEAELSWDLAHRLAGRLGALGATAYLTRAQEADPPPAERAGFANDIRADVFVSLHCDAAASAACNGASTYFYGTHAGAGSPTGARLAALVQEEVCTRTDLLDCHSHPKSWDLLRLTRMPAVRVDAGYLTHPGDAARLGDGRFRDTLAEAVVAALTRLYAATPAAAPPPASSSPAAAPGRPPHPPARTPSP